MARYSRDADSGYGGQFTLAIDGVGLVWPDAAANVEDDNGVLTLTYTGGAKVDSAASIDFLFAWGFELSGEPATNVALEVEVTIQPDHVTAAGTFTVASTQYSLDSSPPPHTAAGDIDQAIGNMVEANWEDVWDQLYSSAQAEIPLLAWTDTVGDLQTELGAIVQALRIEPVVYQGEPGPGHFTARGDSLIVSDTVSRAMALLFDEDVEHLPVVDADGRVLGMCTRTDILRARHRERDEDLRQAPPLLGTWPGTLRFSRLVREKTRSGED